MPVFCKQCGTQVPDGNAFCSNCGAPVEQAPAVNFNNQSAPIPDNNQNFAQQPAPQPQNFGQQGQNGFAGQPQQPFMGGQGGQGGFAQPQFAGQPGQAGKPGFNPKAMLQKIPPKYLKFGGIGIGALIVLIIILSIFTGSSMEDPFKNYKKVLEKGDTKAYSACFFDDDILTGDGESASEIKETVKDMRKDFIEDYGANAKVTYEITDKEALSKSDIKEYNALITAMGTMGAKNAKKYKIKKGYTVKVIFTYEGSEDIETDKETVTVVETSKGWMFLDDTPSSIYYW